MRRTASMCLVASFLATISARAQSPQTPDASQGGAHAVSRRISSQLLRPGLLSGAMPLDSMLVAVSRQDPQPVPAAAQSHARLIGALIGVAAGVTAAALYWENSNCQYGSDSFGAITTHCIVPSGAMIAGGWYGGWYIGDAIGR